MTRTGRALVTLTQLAGASAIGYGAFLLGSWPALLLVAGVFVLGFGIAAEFATEPRSSHSSATIMKPDTHTTKGPTGNVTLHEVSQRQATATVHRKPGPS